MADKILATSLVIHNTGARLHILDRPINAGDRVSYSSEQVQLMRKAFEFHAGINPAKLGSREKRELKLLAVVDGGKQVEIQTVDEFRVLFPIPKPAQPKAAAPQG